ncbi:MAG: SIS domain-containing protein [Verrucomicrobiota bacterium]
MTPFQAALDGAIKSLEALRTLEPDLLRAAELVKTCLLGGGKLLACGNGGSAADVSDFTTEYTCRFLAERRPYPALNLTADGGLLAAIGNDYAFEDIFSRQVAAFGKAGDVLIVATTSGRSKNILRALDEAKRLGLHSIALLGKDGGETRGRATVELLVPSQTTARIQEAHKFLFHLICELVDPHLAA